MDGREIEVMVKGTAGSGVTSLTSDLVRALEKVGAVVMVDPSCTFDGAEPICQPGQTFKNLKSVRVTVKNARALRHSVTDDVDFDQDAVRLGENEFFDVRTDRLINTVKVMAILNIRRDKLASLQADGLFPKAHFKFGQQFRWVERIVLEWKAKNQPTQQEQDEAAMHSKGVVTGEVLDS